MKKFFVSLVMLLSLSAANVFAQSSLIATLSHEGEITAFYGADALKEAHEAAVHGDAITLSSGTFTATNITKAITLRGAGMQVDTINNVLPSIINGNFTIQIADTVTKKLTIEGVYNNHTITVYATLNGARFIKNRFKEFKSYYSSSSGSSMNNARLDNTTFLHCKITTGFVIEHYGDVTFCNCYIANLISYSSSVQMRNSIIHCKGRSISYYLNNSSLYNCLIIGNNTSGSGDYLSSSCIAYNCVAMNCYDSNCFRYIPNTTNTHSTYTKVFKDFTGTYNDNITFELTDEAKAKFLGTDDTQVGIYGGNFPYDPATTNPHITKCNVAAKSTADGKLSVDIEVAGVE